jgi:acetoin utilization protein AcuB
MEKIRAAKIQDYMTKNPFSLNSDMSVESAVLLMFEHDIRHVPVLEEGRLVGIVSDRDISRAGINEHLVSLKIRDVMTALPYNVSPDTPMTEVLQTMASSKLGCVVVQGQGGSLAGIFTAIDAVQTLAKSLANMEK